MMIIDIIISPRPLRTKETLPKFFVNFRLRNFVKSEIFSNFGRLEYEELLVINCIFYLN